MKHTSNADKATDQRRDTRTTIPEILRHVTRSQARLDILHALQDQALRTGELHDAVPHPRSTVTQNLRQLREHDLVEEHRRQWRLTKVGGQLSRSLEQLEETAPLDVQDVAELLDTNEERAAGELRNLQQDGLVTRDPEEGFYLSEQLDEDDGEDGGGEESSDDVDEDRDENSDSDESRSHGPVPPDGATVRGGIDEDLEDDEALIGASPNGKYHLDSSCGWAPVEGNGEIVSLDEARDGSRDPCSSCAGDEPRSQRDEVVQELASAASVLIELDVDDLPRDVRDAVLQEVLED